MKKYLCGFIFNFFIFGLLPHRVQSQSHFPGLQIQKALLQHPVHEPMKMNFGGHINEPESVLLNPPLLERSHYLDNVVFYSRHFGETGYTPDRKYSYSYNTQGLVDVILSSAWIDSLAIWNDFGLTKYTHDNRNNVIKTEDINPDNGTLNGISYHDYDQNNFLFSEIEFINHIAVDTFIPFRKSEYEYDQSGRIKRRIEYWNTNPGGGTGLEPYSLVEREYESTQDEYTDFYYWVHFGDHEWTLSLKVENKFSTDRDTLFINYFNWSENQQKWYPNSKYIFVYNKQKQLTEETVLEINYLNNKFYNVRRTKYEYHPEFNTITRTTEFEGNKYNNFWLPKRQDERSYDDAGNAVMNSYAEWNPTDSKWRIIYLDSFFVDKSLPVSDVILPNPHMYHVDVRHAVLKQVKYREENGQWTDRSFMQFNYSKKTTSTSDNQKTANTCFIYPIPTFDKLRIEGIDSGKATLFNTRGSVEAIYQITGLMEIDVTSLAPGVYFIRFENGENIPVVKRWIKM